MGRLNEAAGVCGGRGTYGYSIDSETPGSVEAKPAEGWLCPHCGGPMMLIEKLTAEQIRKRSVQRKTLVDSS